MDLFESISSYYGDAMDGQTSSYLSEKTKNFSERQKEFLFQTLCETRPKKFGAPDIAGIAKVIQDTYKSCGIMKSYAYGAKKCKKCGTLYAMDMDCCPTCFNSENMGYGSKSDEYGTIGLESDENVVRYNCGALLPPTGNKNCFVCENHNFFCEYFNKVKNEPCYKANSCPCGKCCTAWSVKNEKSLEDFKVFIKTLKQG